MSFSINTRKVGGVIVVDLSGSLTMGEPALLLRETIRHFVADSNIRYILNLAQVSYIDSGGLGELITTYTTVRNRKGDITSNS
jgi:anti-sigma B factor antagonist